MVSLASICVRMFLHEMYLIPVHFTVLKLPPRSNSLITAKHCKNVEFTHLNKFLNPNKTKSFHFHQRQLFRNKAWIRTELLEFGAFLLQIQNE